jgi:hypothetical protein
VPQQEQPEVHRRGTCDEVDEDVGVCVRLHPDRQLVGEVAHRLVWAITEPQVWVLPKFQTIPEVPDYAVASFMTISEDTFGIADSRGAPAILACADLNVWTL